MEMGILHHIQESVLNPNDINRIFYFAKDVVQPYIERILLDDKLYRVLEESQFDLVIADGIPFAKGVSLLWEKLGLPFVSVVVTPPPTVTRAVSHSSFVPSLLTALTERMTFTERLKNMFMNVMITGLFS